MNRTLLIALSALLSIPVWAEDSVFSKLDPAWTEVEKKAVQALGQPVQRQLVDMAYAEIATDACPGIVLSKTAMTGGFDQISASSGKTNAVEKQTFDRNMMAFFGVYTGLILAESFIDKEAFCAGVDGVKQRKSGPTKFWTAK